MLSLILDNILRYVGKPVAPVNRSRRQRPRYGSNDSNARRERGESELVHVVDRYQSGTLQNDNFASGQSVTNH